jgi:hypothetical protein
MYVYWAGRGRKKAVRKFTYVQGLCMLAFVTGVLLAVILLWHFGIIGFDFD